MPTLPNIPEPPPSPEEILAGMLEKRERLRKTYQQLANQEINHASQSET
ncbi:MAG: hypothetical protein ACKN9E_13425 [Microcystaceae cyanobacterium]